MTNHVISINQISFGYTAEDVIRGLSMTVHTGELCVIIGDNGSGKSTLLKLLLGEIRPHTGTIHLMDTPLEAIKDFRFVGYMPQVNNVNQVAFPITGTEMVVQNLHREFGLIKIPRRAHRRRAEQMLEQMGLGPYKHMPFKDLSGGLQQRVMICRAMINQPRLLILDEPTAGVDPKSKQDFLKLIAHMNRDRGITVVLVTHELKLVRNELQVDHVYQMNGGELFRVAV